MNRRDLLWAGAAAGAVGLGGLGRMSTWAAASQVAAVNQPSPTEPLWLCWNENPAGLAPTARQAVFEAIGRANRYPDALREELTAELATRHGVETENIVLGAGSTQILQMIVLAAAAPGSALVLAEPTFEVILRYQRPLSYRVERVPLDSRHAHDLERMRERVGSRPAVVYLCNPNNPTGTLTASAEIDAWIAAAPETVLFAIDEAYFEYAKAPGFWSAIKWIRERPNVVVTRTFSKIYAMAGMRLGYAFAHASTARRLRQFMSSDNANVLALAAARACLEDNELLPRSRALNRKSLTVAEECLSELGIEYLPSHTNFLMHRINGDLELYIRRMREHGILVGRPFPPMLGFNRLSLGLPAEMERWAVTLRQFRDRGWV